MGFTYVEVELSNPVNPERTVRVELGIRPVGKRKLRIFGGIVEQEVGGALIKYKETYAVVPVVFGEEENTPILGSTGLEALGYQIDPVTKQLKPTELLMV